MSEPADHEIESISAVTLTVSDLNVSVAFYEALGFQRHWGGPERGFVTYRVGGQYLNLAATAGVPPGDRTWGRVICYVRDVDAMHARALSAGFSPQSVPRDAEWGERYFHLRDPDGHELSFARSLAR
ncbi:MAG: VOC family protein [Chloroflexi bacterium]|nr:VOC family protein [Chloroflexota bacterium]